MPRKKKTSPRPSCKNGGKKSELRLNQQTNPLLSLSRTDIALPELRILDMYLDRLDMRDEEKRTVLFEKGEIEQVLGVTQILKDDLIKCLLKLGQVVEINDENNPKWFMFVSLFEDIDAFQDDNDNDGLWRVSLTCTRSAREYIFNIENIGNLQYRLKSIINLTSKYSYILYLWLEHNRYRQSWEIELKGLKSLLQCPKKDTSSFQQFNDLVLAKCQREILEKTDCRFTYEPINEGQSVRFTVETLPVIELEDVPEPIFIDSNDN